MSDDILGSDKGIGSTIEESDNLEQFMYATSRKDWDEIKKSMRIEGWMDSLMYSIRVRENTNSAEIISKAYLLGLKDFRDEYKDEVDDIQRMLMHLHELARSSGLRREHKDDVYKSIMEYEFDMQRVGTEDLSKPKTFYIKSSALAEVNGDYVEDGIFGSWLHRLLSAFGLIHSKHSGGDEEGVVDSYNATLHGNLEDARLHIESFVRDFLYNAHTHWRLNGYDMDHIDKIEEIISRMETKHKDDCEDVLDLMVEDINEH